MKKEYLKPDLEIVSFKSDVVLASQLGTNDDFGNDPYDSEWL